MKKLLSLILTLTLLLISGGIAASAETTGENTVLYSAAEITDVDALIQRSLAGVDELKENTGYELSVSSSDTAPAASTFSLAPSAPQPEETYVTSQLLRSELVDGKRIDTYAAKVVRSILPYYGSKTSGELISTIYANFDDVNDKMQMVNTTATITVGGAARLVMTNGFMERPEYGMITTSSQYSNPGTGTYYLDRCSSGWIGPMGKLYLRNMLHYDNGSVTKLEFSMKSYGQIIDE